MTEPFRDLVHRYQDLVCGVAYAVLRDRARSEEVAQDAFLVAWQKLPAMSPPPAMPGWLCAITRNLARNAARKRRETPMTSSTGGEPVTSATPLGDLLDAETEALANRALAELPDGYREVVVLHYRGERSVAEIAGALGISEANAKQRLHRGRERLRSTLAAVEKTLRATRPGPAFTAACVAALAAGGASAEAASIATKSSGWGTATVVAVPVAAAIVLGAGGFAVVRYSGGETHTPSGAQVADIAGGGPAQAVGGSARPSDPPKHPRAPVAIRRLDKQQRALLGERIEEARRRRETTSATLTTSGGGAGGAAAPALPGTLSKEEIRGAVSAVVPLLAECYDEALPRLGNVGGKLMVKMKLTGEPDVGTVVDAHSVDGDPHLTADVELTRCWRETMNAIELPPLAAGGEVEVNYPFVVRPADDGSGAN